MATLGKPLRWLCLLLWLSHQIYFLAHGFGLLKNQDGEMAGIFICENSNDSQLIQCTGLGDDTTCGDGIQCIQSSCGRPLFRHIGVSYAGSSDPFDPDAATSTKSLLTILALLYSLVPYMLLMYFTVHFLALGNVVPLTRLGMMIFTSLVNDALLKNVMKQPRPTGSCLYFHSFGMPSGHAASSIGLLTFMLLELLYKHPNLLGKRRVTMLASNDGVEIRSTSQFTFTWGHGWQIQTTAPESNVVEENKLSRQGSSGGADNERSLLSSSESISEDSFSKAMSYRIIHNLSLENYFQSNWLHHHYALLWLIIMLPVPFSRVYLHDHTPMQIFMGSLVGTILGFIWYFCIIRGWLFRSVTVNNGKIVSCIVKSHVGKFIDLNVGTGDGQIQVQVS